MSFTNVSSFLRVGSRHRQLSVRLRLPPVSLSVQSIRFLGPAVAPHPQPEPRLQTVTCGTWRAGQRDLRAMSSLKLLVRAVVAPADGHLSQAAEQDTRKEGDRGDCPCSPPAHMPGTAWPSSACGERGGAERGSSRTD